MDAAVIAGGVVLGTKEGWESEKGHSRVFFVPAAQVGSDIFFNKPQEPEF